MAEQHDRGRASLRTILVWPFLLLILLTGATVGFLSFSNARDAVTLVSGAMRSEITSRVRAHLTEFFSIPERINRLNALAISSGAVEATSSQALMLRFLQQAQVFETVTSLYFGNTAGGIIVGGREGPGGDLYKIYTDGFTKGTFHKVRTDADGHPVEPLLVIPEFDARTRPWYQAAVETGGSAWSDIYVLFTGDGMAIAPSHPVYSSSGSLIGVVAADIFLSHINDFLHNLHRHQPGQTIILEPSGLLVATSSGAPLFVTRTGDTPGRRLHAWESGDAAIQALGEHLRHQLQELTGSETDRHEIIDIDGEPHFLELSPFTDAHGLSLIIAIATPQSAHLGPVIDNNRSTLMLVVMALLATGLTGVYIARWIAKPILTLNESARIIAAGDLSHRIVLQRRDELGQLAQSFNKMAAKLQASFHHQKQQLDELKQREEALRASEERFSLAMRGANDGLWDWDLKTGTVYYSPRWKSMLGYEEAEIVSGVAEWTTRLHPDDAGISRRRFTDCMESKHDRYECEYRMRHKNGEDRWLLSRGFVVNDANGRPIRFVGTHVDITDWKAAQSKILALTERISLATEAGQVGIWDLDISQNRLHWEPVMFDLYGISEKAFGGTYEAWQSLVHPDDLPTVLAGANRAMAQGLSRYQTSYRTIRPDGTIRSIDAQVAFVYREDGQPTRMFGVNIDVTAVKLAEEALRLEKEKAEQANAAKSRFLATMSHELRTPLNAIIGFAGLLLSKETEADRREQLSMISQAGENLLNLIGDILDLSRIEAGHTEVHLTTSDLEGELARVSNLFKKQLDQRSLHFSSHIHPDTPTRIRTDFDLLRQILINLIGNAIKFTSEGHISLSVRAHTTTEAKAQQILFQVRDTGIGIEHVHLERIFESFEQAHETMTRTFSGSGLGLSICRRLVSLLGGRIWVESEPGVGSCFSFTIDVEVAPPYQDLQTDAAYPVQGQPGMGQAILVVEDDVMNRRLMETILKDVGYCVYTAEDGPAALSTLETTPVDLVLMDIQLPKMNGLEVTKRIRSGAVSSCPASIPIVALTAFAIAGDQAHFLAEGMDGYLSKPVDHRRLLATITTLLHRPDYRIQIGS